MTAAEKTVPAAENYMPHAMGGGAHARCGTKMPMRQGKTVTAAENFMPHDVGEWAGSVTPRVARGEFFIFPYRGEGVFGWLERAPWHGAVKNVPAAWPNA